MLADPEGRFLFLKGRVGELQFTLATLYAPNEHQDSFIKRTIEKLMDYKVGQLILTGGLQCTSDSHSGHLFWYLLLSTITSETYYTNPT